MMEAFKLLEDAPPYLNLLVMVWGVLELRYSRRVFNDHMKFYHHRRKTDVDYG
jgi:hypothetical protein